MNANSRQRSLSRIVLIGILYGAIGVLFALPANQGRVWRLAAWLLSAGVYAAHIWYEHYRLRNASRTTALHAGLAAGVGGLVLAIAATIHSLFVPVNYQRSRFLIALVVWPILTAVPAFLVALIAGAVLARLPFDRNSI